MTEYKKCPKCKRILELNNNNFYNNKSTKNGFVCYCKDCSKILRKKQYKKNPLLTHKHNIKRLYGINYKDYLELLEKQNNKCAICKLTLKESNPLNGKGKSKHFHIDHDHKTGKIRGLLCTNCNQGLGRYKHNPFAIFNAIKYLKNMV